MRRDVPLRKRGSEVRKMRVFAFENVKETFLLDGHCLENILEDPFLRGSVFYLHI